MTRLIEYVLLYTLIRLYCRTMAVPPVLGSVSRNTGFLISCGNPELSSNICFDACAEGGYEVHLIVDGISSSRLSDRSVALQVRRLCPDL